MLSEQAVFDDPSDVAEPRLAEWILGQLLTPQGRWNAAGDVGTSGFEHFFGFFVAFSHKQKIMGFSTPL